MKNYLKENWVFVLIILISAFLLFYNLNNKMLWQDEAETAILAQTVLETGFPHNSLGNNTIIITGYDTNKHGLWSWHSWGQHYLTALSFKLFGESTFAARFLFAVLGFLSIFVIKRLADELYESKKITNLAIILMILGTAFMTYSRQCRYYSALIFLVPYLILISYRFSQNTSKTSDKIKFVIFNILLFHFNYLTFFIINASFLFWLIIDNYVMRAKLLRIREFVIMWLIIVIFTLPWAIVVNLFNKGPNLLVLDFKFIYNLYYYLVETNIILPFLLILGMILFFYKTGYWRYEEKFLFFMLVFPFILLLFSPIKSFRYLIGNISIYYILLALFIKKIWNKHRFMAVILFLLVITTVISSLIPGLVIKNSSMQEIVIEKCSNGLGDISKCNEIYEGMIKDYQIRIPFFKFIQELGSKYHGPVEGIVEYLDKNNSTGIVFTNYDTSTLMFYTSLRIYNPLLQNISNIAPNFIIPRGETTPAKLGEVIENYKSKCKVTEIILDSPNQLWQDREGIISHQFTSPKTKNNQTILKVLCY